MKKASGSLRIDLAQYREMEVFTQFSSDLDEATKAQLDYGKSIMELLKQPLGRPLSSSEQVITLWVATHKVMTGIPVKEIKAFQMDMLAYFEKEHPEICREIEEKKVLSDELGEQILKVQRNLRTRTGDEMASAKEIQSRIKSIQDTMKITNAMYMISSSKMKRAKQISGRYGTLFLRIAVCYRTCPASCTGY